MARPGEALDVREAGLHVRHGADGARVELPISLEVVGEDGA